MGSSMMLQLNGIMHLHSIRTIDPSTLNASGLNFKLDGFDIEDLRSEPFRPALLLG